MKNQDPTARRMRALTHLFPQAARGAEQCWRFAPSATVARQGGASGQVAPALGEMRGVRKGKLALLGWAVAWMTVGLAGAVNAQETTAEAPGVAVAEAGAKSALLSVAELAGLVEICRVPDPKVPSSAFAVERSEPVQRDADYWLEDYSLRYRCKEVCEDWRQCQAPAYAWDNGDLMYHGRQPDLPKQSVAFVVDGMGGHLAYTTDGGDKTIFSHGGGGGIGHDPSVALLEQRSDVNTVSMSWAMGYAPPNIPGAPPFPLAWGWYTRNSAAAERVPNLNRRVAAAIAWSHENLAGPSTFATRGCSMGAVATFGVVLWHGLDDIIDYQALGGGPPLYDINAGCGRRTYDQGYCDLDANVPCTADADCKAVSTDSICRVPEMIPADWAYESVINHVHATTACRIPEGGDEPYPPFDESSMMAADDGDWDIDHSVDLIVDVGRDYDPEQLSGGDEHWSLGHFMYVFNRMNMQAGSDKQWHASENSNHCESFDSEAVMGLIMARMGLEDSR